MNWSDWLIPIRQSRNAVPSQLSSGGWLSFLQLGFSDVRRGLVFNSRTEWQIFPVHKPLTIGNHKDTHVSLLKEGAVCGQGISGDSCSTVISGTS
jgi:hypothetical protein